MRKFFINTIIILIVFLVCAYFIMTNSLFIKSVALPAISNSTDVKITVTAIEISPLRGVFFFDNLSITQNNKFSANIAHFDTRLNIFDLFFNKLTINNLNLENTYIKIIQSAYLEQQKDKKQKHQAKNNTKTGTSNSRPCKFHLKDIKIADFNISYSLQRKNARESSISEIKNLNIDIPYFETNGKGLLNFSSGLAAISEKSTFSGTIQGNINAIIGKNGIPEDFDLSAGLKLGENTSPIACKFNSKQSGKKIPFAVSLNINNLPLQPFFQAFVKGSYQETNGYIKDLKINANAPDLLDENILQSLNGNLILSTKDIYIPSDLLQNPLIQVMLIPLDVISKFDNAASFKLFSNNSSSIKSTTSEIISGEKLLEFKTGNIRISMKNGDANISNFEFDGTSRSAVQKITITGTIDKNQQINLNTITKISGISIPLRLKGTLTNPQHEPIELIFGIINQGVDTIGAVIDAASQNSEINKTTKSILDTIDSITTESKKSPDVIENSVENLFDGIKKLTD